MKNFFKDAIVMFVELMFMLVYCAVFVILPAGLLVAGFVALGFWMGLWVLLPGIPLLLLGAVLVGCMNAYIQEWLEGKMT